jgi:uncharacterized protein YllA (UPF0747 family)
LQNWELTARKNYADEMSLKELNHLIWDQKRHLYKQTWKMYLNKENLTYSALHRLKNFLHPYRTRQERILNWFGFQAASQENLLDACLKIFNWRESGHHFCFLERK